MALIVPIIALGLPSAAAADFTGRFQSNDRHAVECEASIGVSEAVSCISTDSRTPQLVLRNRFTEEEPPSPIYGCRHHDAFETWTLKAAGRVRLQESCRTPLLLKGGHGRVLREGQTIHVASITCYGEHDAILCESRTSRRGFTLE